MAEKNMPALPEPFIKPMAANGLESKPGLYTLGQLTAYAQQYAEQQRSADLEAMRMAVEALEYHVAQTRPIARTSEAIAALRARVEG